MFMLTESIQNLNKNKNKHSIHANFKIGVKFFNLSMMFTIVNMNKKKEIKNFMLVLRLHEHSAR